jgi:chemosensory pili system protein ChpA (sensor histidine kinase/response regulator)
LELPATAPVPEDDDDDLLGIFLDEAREVVGTGQAALGALEHDPSDGEQLTTLRRAFHTLKGSSRMVGLGEFGAAAWSLEQLLNARLAEHRPADDDLRGVAGEALQALSNWVEAVARQQAGDWSAAPFEAMADALRLRGERVGLAAAAAPAREPAAATPPGAVAPSLDAVPAPDERSIEPPAADLAAGQTGASDTGQVRDGLLQAFDLPDLNRPSPSC